MDNAFEMSAPVRNRARDSWPRQEVTVATLEQICRADELRLQIRKSYLSRGDPPPSVWITGVD